MPILQQRAITLCLLAALSGCASSSSFHELSAHLKQQKEQASLESRTLAAPQPPDIYYPAFTPVDLTDHTIFELSETQQTEFLDYFNHPSIAHIRPHQRVANYLLTLNKHFTYRGKTLNATRALAQKEGNCMSLAILSTAIAKLADVRYTYREVHSEPVFSEQSDIQFLSTHVNITLLDEKLVNTYPNNGLTHITIDYFRQPGHINSSRVSQKIVEIMYWNNLASEALLAGDLNLAFSYTLKANELDPLHPESLNMLAILYNRKGHEPLAYAVYDFMDTHKIASFSAIDNFASLLKKRGEHQRANVLTQSIKSVTEDNPYTWIRRGKAHLEQGRLKLAEYHFAFAIEKASYLHEAHFFLAQVYAMQSKPAAARQALETAQSLAYLPDDEKRYRAKLAGLQSSTM